MTRVVVVSDYCDGSPVPSKFSRADFRAAHDRSNRICATDADYPVIGGYLERLPLALMSQRACDSAEIWTFCGHDTPEGFDTGRALQNGPPPFVTKSHDGLIRRVFRANGHPAPYGSDDVLAHLQCHGAPNILCVWGLGVTEEILLACTKSIKIYNSIDADAIRVPVNVSRHFDIFLTGADWQSAEIEARHPGALCAVLPVGPEFASDVTFHPTGAPKDYDVIYVAATQAYKRHDLMIDTLATLPHLRGLCVVGYGHMTDELRQDALSRGANIDWIGPFDHDGVNAQINRAKVGLVCGVDDGAPAILTEYMLAGLPVLANDRLSCGRQYIRPDTGRMAAEADFATVLTDLLAHHETFDTRKVVQEEWTWPHSVTRFDNLLQQARTRRNDRQFK